MDKRLNHELSTRLDVLRRVLRDVSAISAQMRRELDAQLDDTSALQRTLDAASARLQSSATGNEVR